MKDLIIQALNEAHNRLLKSIPQTKKVEKTISIMDVKPIELLAFMKDNDIPDNAVFHGTDNGYDGWDDFVLAWDIEIPTSDSDKLLHKRLRFSEIAHQMVYDLLTKNGYKRVRVSSQNLKGYSSSHIYEMFLNKDFDGFLDYYSLYFKKDLDN